MDNRRRSGVYVIINKVNGRGYVGSALSLLNRIRGHFSALRDNRHVNAHLQRAFNKYGEGAFAVAVLEFVDSNINLIPREQFYLDLLQPHTHGYNICPTAGSTLGVKRPPFSEEWRRKMIKPGAKNPFFGRSHSEETKKQISDKAKLRMTDPTKNYFYDKHLTGTQNGMYGKTHTPEARKKIGAPHKGKKLTPQHIDILRRVTSLRSAKAVEQLTMGGELIIKHRRILDAANAIGTSGSYLSILLRRDGTPVFRNYRWRFAA